jgi:hypothetical protein
MSPGRGVQVGMSPGVSATDADCVSATGALQLCKASITKSSDVMMTRTLIETIFIMLGWKSKSQATAWLFDVTAYMPSSLSFAP